MKPIYFFNSVCEKLNKCHLYPMAFVNKLLFLRKFKRWPKINNPQDLNEIMMFLSYKTDTSKWVELADKYKVREYVLNKGCGELLVKLYGKYDRVEDIDFDSLPDSFVIKVNNGYGSVIIVEDKNKLDYNELKKRVQILLKGTFGYLTGEKHYTKIKKCIIIEEYLSWDASISSSLIDYKFWCINGRPIFCFCCSNRNIEEHKVDFAYYELPEWKIRKDLMTPDYANNSVVPKPNHLNEMLDYSSRLSEGFPLVRIDLYESNGKVYFGEMTFTSNACHMSYFIQSEILRLGQMVDLSNVEKLK